MHWREVWQGSSVIARLLRMLLFPLSCLYWVGWETYLLLYKLGIKRPAEPHCPVICVGNLVAGGTGKSPVTAIIAKALMAVGRETVVSCSGYGSPASEEASLAPVGELDAQEWGDEASMLRSAIPSLKLIVGRNRVKAAQLCHKHFPNAILLLDDGFQHLPLRKHISIVLDPPQKNRLCIPAGPYREPAANRKRADLVLPNGFRPLFLIDRFETPTGKTVELGKGSKVSVLCALADPTRFARDLVALGLSIQASVILKDHDPLDAGNLFASLNPDLPVVVTAKDWVKLRNRPDLGGRQILIARQEARIEPEAEFREWLLRKLDELAKEHPRF
jgi:tetraacyldisaccharide 4'-kinase